MYSFQNGTTYTFSTLAPTVLGAQFKNATVVGANVGYDVAKNFNNIDLIHRAVYPLLPAGTVDDATKFTYVILKTENGSMTAIATEWIDESTIVSTQSVTITVVVRNASVSDATTIRDSLKLMGFTNVTTTVD